MHPSHGRPDDDDNDMDSVLPDGVTPEKAGALVEAVIAEIEKLGLYPRHAHLAIPDQDSDNPENLMMIHAIFTFGKVAFTPRVQDPEQDDFNDQFRGIEVDETIARSREIVERFKRGHQNPDA